MKLLHGVVEDSGIDLNGKYMQVAMVGGENIDEFIVVATVIEEEVDFEDEVGHNEVAKKLSKALGYEDDEAEEVALSDFEEDMKNVSIRSAETVETISGKEDKGSKGRQGGLNSKGTRSQLTVLCVKELDLITALAVDLVNFELSSRLYKLDDRYFICIDSWNSDVGSVRDLCREYGELRETSTAEMDIAYLEEHGVLMIKNDALRVMCSI